MFREIWITIRLVIDAILNGIADITQAITFVSGQNRTEIEVYFAGLRRMALITILLPVPVLILGIITGLGWLTALIGIFWAICTLGLLLIAAPLGLLIEALLNTIKGVALKETGQKYVKIVLGIYLIELTFTLFVSVVPIGNNLAAIPVVIIAATLLGILGATGTKTALTKKLIGGLTTVILIILTLSFFFPLTFKEGKKMREKMDKSIAAVLGGQVMAPKAPVAVSQQWYFSSGTGDELESVPACVTADTTEIRIVYKLLWRQNQVGEIYARSYDGTNFTGKFQWPGADGEVEIKKISSTLYKGSWRDPDSLKKEDREWGIHRIQIVLSSI